MIKYRTLIIFICGIFYFTNINSQITPEWVSTYYGNYPVSFTQSDMVADKYGNVFVLGYSQDTAYNTSLITIKYNTNGTLEWFRTYDSLGNYTRITIDDSSNVYIAGTSTVNYSYITLKYNTLGIFQWAKSYTTSGFYNMVYDIITDDSNSVYITGQSNGFKFTTLKYNRNGDLVWVALDSAVLGQSCSYIDIDNNNNVYVTGRGGDTLATCNTFKYNNSGVKQWERIYKGNYTPGGAGPADIICCNNGFIYVLAGTTNYYGEGDFAVIKYDTNGSQIWASIYSYSTYYDYPKAMTVDKSGNVYVTGHINPGNALLDAFATVKFDSSGIFKWVKTYTEGYGNWDRPNAITIDSIGFIYVTGESPDSLNHENFATIKYDSNGNEIWVARYSHILNSGNIANSICLDKTGNIYISGTTYYPNSTGILTIKYGHNVGVEELFNSVNNYVFPNPFEDNVTIKLEVELKNAELIIYDIQGRVVYFMNEINKREITIQRNNLKTGLYFFRLFENNKTIATGKIIAK